MADVVSGQVFQPEASEWNAFRQAARAVGNLVSSGGDGDSLGLRPGRVLVHNGLAMDLEQFSVVRLGNCGTFNPSEYRGRTPILEALEVRTEFDPFAVLLTPLAIGETGVAQYAGVLVFRVEPTKNHRGDYAAPQAGCHLLKQATSGPVRLLDVLTEIQGAEYDWAVGLIEMNQQGDTMPAVVVDDSSDSGSDEEGLCTVDVYDNGLDYAVTRRATLSLTDLCQGSRLPAGTVVLAHSIVTRFMQDQSEE